MRTPRLKSVRSAIFEIVNQLTAEPGSSLQKMSASRWLSSTSSPASGPKLRQPTPRLFSISSPAQHS
jgi:hypothetical protein